MFEPKIFDNDDVARWLTYEAPATLGDVNRAIGYVAKQLEAAGNILNLTDIEGSSWREGKSYNWAVAPLEKGYVVVRHYGTHFTLYSVNRPEKGQTSRAVLTFNTNTDHPDIKNSDEYVDDNFVDFRKLWPVFVGLIKEGKIALLWCRIPKHTETKCALAHSGVRDINTYIFAAEEITKLAEEIFAETELTNFLAPYVNLPLTGTYEGCTLRQDRDGGVYMERPGTYGLDVYRIARWEWPTLRDYLPSVK